jgi:hypothetical protein
MHELGDQKPFIEALTGELTVWEQFDIDYKSESFNVIVASHFFVHFFSSSKNSLQLFKVNMDNNMLNFTTSDGIFYLAGGDHANCTVTACPIQLSTYGYRPSLPCSATLIAIYAIILLVQAYLGIMYRSWWFTGAMIAGSIDEGVGYAGRIMLYQNPWGNSGFIMQIGKLFNDSWKSC